MFILLKIIGILLFPLVCLYTLVVYFRNKFYDWARLKSCSIDAPVISIGNIQLGGTGKTPLVEYLAHKILDMGYQPAILTRGYGRKEQVSIIINKGERDKIHPQIMGDEPFLLSQNLPDVIIGVDGDRCRIARKILQQNSDVVFILDDGFQHRKLRRNVDIVLIDVSRWSALPLLFPLTQFRDVKSSLGRAHLFVLTRGEGFAEKANILKRFLTEKYRAPVLKAEIKPGVLQAIKGKEQLPPENLRGKKTAAFCGVANPDQFFRMLKMMGANLGWTKVFPDHHNYTETELSKILAATQANRAELLITTQKDAVKLQEILPDSGRNLFYLQLKFEFDDEKELKKRIRHVFSSQR